MKTYATCTSCGDFMLKRTLARHARTTHRQKSLSCGACHKNFKRKDNLERHINEQHERGCDSVDCPICGKHVRPRYLNDHLRSQVCVAKRLLIKGSTDIKQGSTIYLIEARRRFDPATISDAVDVVFTLCKSLTRGLRAEPSSTLQLHHLTPNLTVPMWELRGLALRTIMWNLDWLRTRRRYELRSVLVLMAIMDGGFGLWADACAHARALVGMYAQRGTRSHLDELCDIVAPWSYVFRAVFAAQPFMANDSTTHYPARAAQSVLSKWEVTVDEGIRRGIRFVRGSRGFWRPTKLDSGRIAALD